MLLTREAQDAALAKIGLTDLWGVAGRMAERLAAVGVTTPIELRDADPRFIRERSSVVMERMVHELRGLPCIGFEESPPDRKSIIASRSFGRMVTKLRELEESIGMHTARAAEKLRRQNLAVAHLVVFIHTNRFRPQDRQYMAEQAIRLPVATADTAKLNAAAMRALRSIFRPGHQYKKAGVMLLGLGPAATVQGGLFDAPDDARSAARMRMMDDLNRKFGQDTVTFAVSGRKRGWQMQREFISARYTTRWTDLLSV